MKHLLIQSAPRAAMSALVLALLVVSPASAGSGCWNNITDHSNVQGADDWTYGYWVMPSMVFTPMTEFGLAAPGYWTVDWNRPGPSYWTIVGAGILHPNGAVNNGGKTPAEHEAVLRWTSPINDTVVLDIHLDCFDQGGNGSEFKLRWNLGLIGSVVVGPADTVGYDFQVFVPVVPGDTIDFIIGTFNGDAINDSTALEVTITATSWNVPADLNNDCKVDGADLGLLLSAWGSSGPFADLDNDGDVDGADLGLLLAAWTG